LRAKYQFSNFWVKKGGIVSLAEGFPIVRHMHEPKFIANSIFRAKIALLVTKDSENKMFQLFGVSLASR
jgi:hypothetical protein